MATLDIPDDDAPLRPDAQSSSSGGVPHGADPPQGAFGANSPRLRSRKSATVPTAADIARSKAPGFDVPFETGSASVRTLTSAALERQLKRLETGLAKWTAMLGPVIASNWPSEMFARYPSQSEVSRRWGDTFRGLNLTTLSLFFETDSPMPWRVRRTPHQGNGDASYDLILPQIGDYLNPGLDANPPMDCAKWHIDVTAFCRSAMRQVHSESVALAHITGGAVEFVEGGLS